MLGTRMEIWKPSEFQCTRVIFKNLAVYLGLGIDELKILLTNFLNQKHDRKYISKELRHGDVLSFSSGQHDLGLQLGCSNDRTSCIEYNPTATA
jgi:hypothetical protein